MRCDAVVHLGFALKAPGGPFRFRAIPLIERGGLDAVNRIQAAGMAIVNLLPIAMGGPATARDGSS